MSIVIAGASELGIYLASILSKEQVSVILIDPDQSRLDRVALTADVGTQCASCTDWRVLDEILEQKPRLFLGVSDSDDTNLLGCILAKNLGYPVTVARVTDPSFLEQKRVDMDRLFYVDHLLAPELIVAHDLFKCIMSPGVVAAQNFAHGAVQMRTLILPDSWEEKGKMLEEIDFGEDLLVGAIRRKLVHGHEIEEKIIIPHGKDRLLPGDEVTFIGETSTMLSLPKRFGLATEKVHHVVIAGANLITSHLVDILRDEHIEIKLIEKDEAAAQAFAEQHEDILIINHDPSDFDFLKSERIDHSDVFIAATEGTEFNVMAASLAQEAGVKNVYALVSDTRHSHLLTRLGIHYTLSEKESITSRLLSFIHSDSAVSTRALYENRVLIMELKVSTSTRIAGIPISDLSHIFPKKSLVTLIENRGQIMIAKGDRIIAPGDTVIMMTVPEHVQDIKRIF